jgi:hypothetical protein
MSPSCRNERTPLASAVDQEKVLAREERAHERGEHAGDSFPVDAGKKIHAGADHVERSNDGEIEPAVAAVRPDHALEELLGACVRPALATHGAEKEPRGLFVHLGHRARGRVERRLAVDLAGRKMDESLAARRAALHQGDQIRVARVDDLERLGVVKGGVAEGRQGDDDARAGDDFFDEARSIDASLDPMQAAMGDGELAEVDVDRVDLRATP